MIDSSNTSDKSSHEYDRFMQSCIDLAIIARQRGDSPVGSVVILDGQIIGKGIEGGKTRLDITFHAEIEAIRDAVRFLKSSDLSKCILYTTHEPCIMCSYVIRQARITKIVIGILTPQTGGLSSAYPILLDKTIQKWGNPPELITGIMEKECGKLHNL